jgi:hypothetical protein
MNDAHIRKWHRSPSIPNMRALTPERCRLTRASSGSSVSDAARFLIFRRACRPGATGLSNFRNRSSVDFATMPAWRPTDRSRWAAVMRDIGQRSRPVLRQHGSHAAARPPRRGRHRRTGRPAVARDSAGPSSLADFLDDDVGVDAAEARGVDSCPPGVRRRHESTGGFPVLM